MFGLGMPELLVILVVAVVVIGPKRLPDIARALGKGMREFRRATDEIKHSINIDHDTYNPTSSLEKRHHPPSRAPDNSGEQSEPHSSPREPETVEKDSDQ